MGKLKELLQKDRWPDGKVISLTRHVAYTGSKDYDYYYYVYENAD